MYFCVCDLGSCQYKEKSEHFHTVELSWYFFQNWILRFA